MSKPNIRAFEKKLNEKDILKFESKFGIILPLNFKKFITKYNGGIVLDCDDIRLFLSIGKGQTIEDTIETHQIIEKNIPKGYLPIALDYSDNPIVIDLNIGKNYGKIILVDMDMDMVESILANSLEELLGVKNIDLV